jgi:hypothetical protein
MDNDVLRTAFATTKPVAADARITVFDMAHHDRLD